MKQEPKRLPRPFTRVVPDLNEVMGDYDAAPPMARGSSIPMDLIGHGGSLGRAEAKEVWGLRDREAEALDRASGRLAPERYADRPYRGGGEVPVRDMSRVFRAGYVVGWAGSRPTWDNPYRPETPYGRLWRDGYEAGWRTRIEAGRRGGEGVLP